jgi:hypothetical protein
MNFYGAIQHASIGYGVRRKQWAENSILFFDHDKCQLCWLNATYVENGVEHGKGTVAKLLGLQYATLDLTAEDIKATDWDTI